jgi:HPt (histidine-containing phosphotransfer) domain-containing protein
MAPHNAGQPHARSREFNLGVMCGQAIRLVDKALELSPQQMHQEADVVENMVVQVRDALIDRFRDDDHAPDSRWRIPLQKANIAVSLIAAVQYRSAGLYQSYMEDTRTMLQEIEEALA